MIRVDQNAAGGATPALDPARDAKLRQAAQQLEGVFVQQMYKAMRETVPTGGLFDGGAGEEMFTGLMDEHLAADTPQQWQHGLHDAIYRQLRSAAEQQDGSSASVPPLPPDPSFHSIR